MKYCLMFIATILGAINLNGLSAAEVETVARDQKPYFLLYTTPTNPTFTVDQLVPRFAPVEAISIPKDRSLELNLYETDKEASPSDKHRHALLRSLRYEVGTRALHIRLFKDKQGEPYNNSFIGTLNELIPNQKYAPLHPYVQVLWPGERYSIGIGISYDTWSIATEDGDGGDGDVESEAWTAYLATRWHATQKIAPFLELGWANYQNSFDPFPQWYADGRRIFVFDDAAGLHIAAGCDYTLSKTLSANLYARYVDVSIDGTYIFNGDDRDPESFVFPLEHLAYGLGISCAF